MSFGMASPWKIQSSSQKGLVAAAGSLLAGLLFLWLTCRIPARDSNTVAAMLLGVLLVGGGLAAIIRRDRAGDAAQIDARCRNLAPDSL